MTLTIGKIAGLTDVSPDTLRYYEREGLICPTAKNDAGYRIYDGHSVRRVRFIKKAQRCGFTLTEIRQLLALRASDTALEVQGGSASRPSGRRRDSRPDGKITRQRPASIASPTASISATLVTSQMPAA